MTVLGEWIKTCREAKGWTQPDVAYHWRQTFGIKVDARRIGAWERAENEPSLKNCLRLSQLFEEPLPLTALTEAILDPAKASKLGWTGWPMPIETPALALAGQ